jgi:FlaA1/EpsC-like NDP-sugar epimerase
MPVRILGVNGDDVPIVYTGVRPGEQIHELIWKTNARVKPTQNPDILQVDEGSSLTTGS